MPPICRERLSDLLVGIPNMALEGLFNTYVPYIGDNYGYQLVKDIFDLLIIIGILGLLARPAHQQAFLAEKQCFGLCQTGFDFSHCFMRSFLSRFPLGRGAEFSALKGHPAGVRQFPALRQFRRPCHLQFYDHILVDAFPGCLYFLLFNPQFDPSAPDFRPLQRLLVYPGPQGGLNPNTQ